MWFIYSFLSAFFVACYFALVKRDADGYSFMSSVFFGSGIIQLALSIFNGIPLIGDNFLPSLAVTALINVIAAILYLRAFKSTDLSLAMPMLSFTPVFLLLTSFVLLGEFPTSAGVAGIFLVVSGSYILNFRRNMPILDPFRKLMTNNGVMSMLSVAFLFSISVNFDKMLVLNSDIYFGSAIHLLILGISFFLISEKKPVPLSRFALPAIASAFSTIFMNLALISTIVPYAVSIKRMSILFAVIIGGVYLKEKDFMSRVIGSAIMVLGAAMIILSEILL